MLVNHDAPFVFNLAASRLRKALANTLVFAFGIWPLFSRPATAQSAVESPSIRIPLNLERGVPLHLILVNKLPFRQNEAVHARLVDPLFAFDREVVPPGAEVTGRITGLPGVSKGKRTAAILRGDLTPLRDPVIEFDTLVLKNGTQIPLETRVTPGAGTTVRFASSNGSRKKGRVATAIQSARDQISARKRAVIDEIKTPGKMQRLRDAVVAQLPYHPQFFPAGSRFNAELLTPVNFGDAIMSRSAFAHLGSQPQPDSIVYARLLSGLDSRTSHQGTPVEAVLSRPLYSSDHFLSFPEGSRLHGLVVQSKPARLWHRNGRLRFLFHGIEPPAGSTALVAADPQSRPKVMIRRIEGRLESVDVRSKGSSDKVQMDEEGGTKIASSNTRFIMPAVDVMLAGAGLDHDPVKQGGVPTGAYQANPAGRALSGGVGLGLIGAALGQISRPFAAGLGFWGASWSIYSNVLARGQEVQFPVDTSIEIRVGSRQGKPGTAAHQL